MEKQVSNLGMEMHESLCWSCANAVPSQHTGCTWSLDLEPVEGWVAEDVTHKYIARMNDRDIEADKRTYNVYECPQFRSDCKATDRQTSISKKGLAKLGVAIIKRACDDLTDDYNEVLHAYHRKYISKKKVKRDEVEYFTEKCLSHMRFFRSDYFMELSELNGEWLAKKVLNKAESAYIKERLGDKLEIHLSGKKWLVTDAFQYWIESRTPGKDKKGNDVIHKKRLSGYYSDIDKLFESYFDHTLKESEIKGEIADMMELVKKTRAEIRKWTREIRGDLDD